MRNGVRLVILLYTEKKLNVSVILSIFPLQIIYASPHKITNLSLKTLELNNGVTLNNLPKN